MAARLTKKDSAGNLKQAGFVPWYRHEWADDSAALSITQFGGSFYDDVNETLTVVSDANLMYLEWFLKHAKLVGGTDKVTSLANQAGNLFTAEMLAMQTLAEFEPQGLSGSALDYGVGYPPTLAGVRYGTAQISGGNVFVLPKRAPHPEESADFLAFMASPPSVLEWDVGANNIPPVKAVAFDEKFQQSMPLVKPWFEALKLNLIVPGITSPLGPFLKEGLTAARGEVMNGQKTAKQALTDLAAKVDRELQTFRSSHPNWCGSLTTDKQLSSPTDY